MGRVFDLMAIAGPDLASVQFGEDRQAIQELHPAGGQRQEPSRLNRLPPGGVAAGWATRPNSI